MCPGLLDDYATERVFCNEESNSTYAIRCPCNRTLARVWQIARPMTTESIERTKGT